MGSSGGTSLGPEDWGHLVLTWSPESRLKVRVLKPPHQRKPINRRQDSSARVVGTANNRRQVRISVVGAAMEQITS